MEKIVAIVLNGQALEIQRARQVLKEATTIIAADGGANYCLQHGITANYIIGDLDSIKQNARDIPEQTELIYLSDQYSTDLEKALNLAESLTPDVLRVLNATGKRSDHTIANLLFLARFNKRTKVEVYDNFGKLSFLEPAEHELTLQVGTTVSFTSFGPLQNLTLEGFKYPLRNASFPDFFVGISNVVSKWPCLVRFEQGSLIMYEVERFE